MNNKFQRVRIVALVLILALVAFYLYEVFRPITTTDKLAEIIHLEDRRELSGRLKKHLDDEEESVRARAALAVGRIGAPESGRLLLGMLDDPSWQVASKAVFGCGLTGDTSLMNPLLDYAHDAPAAMTAVAVEAIGRITDTTMPGIVNELTGFLDHASPNVRREAIMALYRAGARRWMPAVLDRLESETDEEVIQTGMYVMSRLGEPQAVELFEHFLGDADPNNRVLAVRGLAQTGSPEAEKYLNIALNDADPHVAAQAALSLRRVAGTTGRKNLVERIRTETNEQILLAAIGSLTELEEPEGVDVAIERASRWPNSNLTAAAARYAATVRNDRAFDYVDSLSRDGGVAIRSACAEALQIIGNESVVPRLSILFGDSVQAVRVAAFGALIAIDSGNAGFYIDQAINDPGYMLNVLAVDEIGQRGLDEYLPAIRDFLDRGEEVEIDVRWSSTDALATFLDREEPDSIALEILYTALADPEYIVRRQARELMKELPDKYRRAVLPVANPRISVGEIKDALEKYDKNPYATIVTNRGEIEIELFFDVAPLTVLNFIELAEKKRYNDGVFHRVVPNFVAQGGDPEGTGWGGPGYLIRCEYSPEPYIRGTVGIATSGKDTGGSQFFFTILPQPHLEGRFTVFGQALYGLEVIDDLVVGDSIRTILISREP